ncbi:MAG: ScyD/ScyE family protein [Acidobacteria bacterium]|nr:ScyD/ScyE family protein [Acidobacteriota bacterium]
MKKMPALGLLAICCGTLGLAQQTPVFASGLKNPSKVVLGANGSLLVTEVGEKPNTGRVSVVDGGGRAQALLEGLPSGAAAPDGTLDGPNGLALAGNVLYVANGEGDSHVAGPAPGTIVPNPNGRSSPIFSSILRVTLTSEPDRITAPFVLSRADHDTLADGKEVRLDNGAGDKAVLMLLTKFQDSVPDARTIYRNSHPYGLSLHPYYPDLLFVADAGMNVIWKISLSTGRAQVHVRFAPIPTGVPARPMAEAVPNSVRAYGDGLLVSLLSGVPFVPQTSSVVLVDPGGRYEPFIPWLSSAIDMAWEERPGNIPTFYSLEFSAALTQGAPGRLKRYDVPDGTVLVNTLRTPTSMALDPARKAMFITDRSGGAVVRVALP